jgi:molecular chaperone GrpE
MAKKKRATHIPISKGDPGGKKEEDAGKNSGDTADESTVKDPTSKKAQDSEKDTAAKSREYDELVDTLQRLKAEYLNYQKRVEREREESRATSMREAFLKVLPVLDNLERAVEAAESGPDDDFRKGVELVLKHFRQVLAGEGIEPFESVGEKFDPRYHEAVMVQESGEVKPDTVLAQMERGYMMGERVLRPAKVIVSRAPKEPEAPAE